ncbi:DUF6261 family protein [Tannerella forsythia]|uniref:Uncharacterized protein n=1 Tax=Tannerella forsythia TaxID=28112 RepID=A0A3P1XKT5_TANFO|nr:DUF6261 family protein [Tannerella forsythia]RRD59394.1 hypothetical protein EII40_09955 [Tannerella forsythia]
MLHVNYTELSTKVLGNLSNRTIEIVSPAYQSGVLQSHPLVDTLIATNKSYQTVVIKNTYSGLGDPVAQADLLRDKAYRSLRRMLQGMAGFKDTPRGKAAAALLTVFEETGDIYGLSYADENVVMQTLINRLDEAVNQGHLSTVVAKDEYDALKQAQAAFEAISAEQTDANSALRQKPSASGARRALHLALRDVFSLVSAMKNLPEWSDLYHDLDELIKEARQSNRKSSKGEPEPPAAP